MELIKFVIDFICGLSPSEIFSYVIALIGTGIGLISYYRSKLVQKPRFKKMSAVITEDMISKNSAEDYTPMLLMESTNSLIDRYILLVSILKTLYATKEDKREEVGNVAFSLYKIIDDNSLLPLWHSAFL